jgi:hypothetical protein
MFRLDLRAVPPVGRECCVSSTDPLLETAQKLGEARRILEGVEATALGGVAQIAREAARIAEERVREIC